MTYKIGDCEIEVKGEVTNVAFGTTADYAYRQYLAKKKMIDDLEYECELLIDKYHSEMKRADIPFMFSKDNLLAMFSKDKKAVKFARELFLEKGFSPEFLKTHKVEFKTFTRHGYTAGKRKTGSYLFVLVHVSQFFRNSGFFSEISFRTGRQEGLL